MSVILKVASSGLLILTIELPSSTASRFTWILNTQFLDQVKVKDTSQLINGISSVIQKFLKSFNGVTISAPSFHELLFPNFSVILVL